VTPYLYSYTDKKGKTVTVERRYPMGAAPNSLKISGRRFVRNVVAEHRGQHKTSCWPIVSTAMGVQPNEIERDRRELAMHGIKNVQYTKDGDIVVPDAQTHRRLRRAIGLRDRKSYVE
jgi:hypothetical protein